MLARHHRIVTADDYRSTVRRGRRVNSSLATAYFRSDPADNNVRFGFIVAKVVGNAVVRNRVRRRLKSVAAAALPDMAPGTDVVIRALPAAAQASWVTLNAEITGVLSKGMARS